MTESPQTTKIHVFAWYSTTAKPGWNLWLLYGQVGASWLVLGAAHADAVPMTSPPPWEPCSAALSDDIPPLPYSCFWRGRTDMIITLFRVEGLGEPFKMLLISPRKPLAPALL